jgi:hypothetical protein
MPAGRPPKPVDWELVDKLIESQNTAGEIAAHFDINPSTLYRQFVDKYGTNFENYARTKYSRGKSLLRTKQFQLALSGNVRMLERLGDIYLDQKDKSEQKPNISININGNLASGIGISAEKLPSTDNNGVE